MPELEVIKLDGEEEEQEIEELKKRVTDIENILSGLNPRNLAGLSSSQISKAANTVKEYNCGTDITKGQAVFVFTDGKIYPAAANTASYSDTFIGFALANSSKGSKVNVAMTGILSDIFSGLAEGNQYYLDDYGQTASIEQTDFTSHKGFGAGESVYQTFTSESTASVSPGARVYIKWTSGTMGIIIRIREGTGTSGTEIAKGDTLSVTSTGWKSFYWDRPVQLETSTTYSITLQWDNNGGGDGWGGNTGNPYAGGQWYDDSDFDAAFTIYKENTTLMGSIDTSAGSVTRKVGIAVADGDLQITNIW